MKCVLKMAELPLAAVTFSCLWRSWREQARRGQARQRTGIKDGCKAPHHQSFSLRPTTRDVKQTIMFDLSERSHSNTEEQEF